MTDKINISAEAVAAMLNGVTPGPWAAAGRFVDTHVLQIADLNAGRTGHEDANTRFIAWAREAVPALAARLAEVEAGLKHYKHEVVETALANEADAEARAEAAEALLSEAVKAGMMEGAKVKPLAWEDFEGRGAKSPAFGTANYLIAKWDNRGFELCESCPGYGGPAIGQRFYSTLDAAKDAAQAHYEAHILTALAEPKPETISRIVAQLKEGRE